jgi:hypothetical protein
VPLTSSPRALWPERRYGKYGRGIGLAMPRGNFRTNAASVHPRRVIESGVCPCRG